MAGWAGVDTPSVDGRSLVPLLSGEGVSWRDALLAKNPGKEGVPGHATLVTRRHLYIEWETGDRELYVLQEDPHETRSIHHTADAALVGSLEDRLDALKACSGQACRDAEDAS
jgi:hypothetical protein